MTSCEAAASTRPMRQRGGNVETRGNMDWERGCALHFDLFTGISEGIPMIKRNLSDLAGMFADDAAYEKALEAGNPVVYEYHAIEVPATDGDIAFGYSVLYPGKVGDEYYFTKGHYHEKLYTAEVYHCMKGHGMLLLEDKSGDWKALELKAGDIGYVPKGYAHRSVNISGSEPFVTVFTYRADAGHDYGAIRTKGFRKMILEEAGQPKFADNPKWMDR